MWSRYFEAFVRKVVEALKEYVEPVGDDQRAERAGEQRLFCRHLAPRQVGTCDRFVTVMHQPGARPRRGLPRHPQPAAHGAGGHRPALPPAGARQALVRRSTGGIASLLSGSIQRAVPGCDPHGCAALSILAPAHPGGERHAGFPGAQLLHPRSGFVQPVHLQELFSQRIPTRKAPI